jgi:4-amino-4-deoxy-L-arabinose transferase-like glycosyltransferase
MATEQTWRHQLIIVCVAAMAMFTNLGGPRLWDRDEPRNAGCAMEMQQRGDWVVPVFNAELRAHKPVMLYWLIMSAYSVFGVNEFAARFWSAALAVGTALATYHIGRRLFHPRVGLWAGVILATSLMFGVAGHAATPDSVLIFLSTVAILIFVLSDQSIESPYFPTSWARAVAMYAVMGLAVLAKGPVGLVLPTAVIGMYLLIMRLPPPAAEATREGWVRRGLGVLRPFAPLHFLRTCWVMRPVTALAIAGAVALPWYIWVGYRTNGVFLEEFFFEHNVGRATRSMENHGGSLLFYPASILVGFFPWSIFTIPVLISVVRRIRRSDAWSPGYILAACWVLVYLGLFSLAATKLPSYITPCYPGLALLTGCFIHHWSSGRSVVAHWWPQLGLGILGLVGLGMIVVIPIACREFLPTENWLGVLGAIPLLGGSCALVLAWKTHRRAAATVVAVTSLAFVTSVFGLALPRVDRYQENHVLLDAIERSGGESRVGAFGVLEPTWVFYGRRPITELSPKLRPAQHPSRSAVAEQPQTSPDRHAKQAGQIQYLTSSQIRKGRPSVREFFGDGEDRLIITTDQQWDDLRQILPPEATVLAECSLFLRPQRLLLVGLEPASKTARAPETAGTVRR